MAMEEFNKPRPICHQSMIIITNNEPEDDDKMSTKSSLAMVNWNEPKEIHIYKEMLDGKYYIETEEERLAIPEKYAKLFAEVIKKDEDENEDCN